MGNFFTTILVTAAFAPVLDDAPRACAQTVNATAFTDRLAGVPQEVREDFVRRIAARGSIVADSNVPLLETDAPSESEKKLAQVRFAQAMHVGDHWFVQLEVAMYAGVRTLTYTLRQDGSFQLSPGQHYGGPGCASIKAALAGVKTFAPF